ncbi:MAG: GNAT family N-acetyltransferase [Sulfurimonas sp.]|nr:GNAT family N-acetyltransferase [Sulfurimonas sp.]
MNTVKLTVPTIADQKLIYDLFLEGVNLNVYDKKLIENLDHLKAMANRMASCPCDFDAAATRNISNYMCTLNDENIGFITLAHDIKINEFEIWYFSLDKKYQHQGYGKKYFAEVCEMIENRKMSSSILVRTKNSKAILSILEQNGFRSDYTNREGFLSFSKNTNVIRL